MGKMIVENSLKLSASSFKKWGCFDNPNQFRSGTVKWGYGDSEHARIDYELNLNVCGLRLMYKYRVCDGEWRDQDYYVEIVWSEPHNSGSGTNEKEVFYTSFPNLLRE